MLVEHRHQLDLTEIINNVNHGIIHLHILKGSDAFAIISVTGR
jgi:hypothetical protein